MAVKMSLAPTKSNLLKLKDELKFARLGYELLDQKRNILVLELLNLIDHAVNHEENTHEMLAIAYDALTDSVLHMGRLKMFQLSGAVNIQADVSLGQRKVMGVTLPLINTSFKRNDTFFSPFGISGSVDLAIDNFAKVLEMIGKMGELKVSIMRLANEVKRTIRKVNALDKIAIPDLQESVNYISMRLEESEREMMILMKSVKKRLAESAPL